MSKRLFSCPAAATEELDYYAEIMEQNDIEYYIVPGTAFGLSKPSMWIKNNDDFARAKDLFVSHQEAYAKQARERYQKETGYNPHADDKEKLRFFFHNLYQKRFLLPWIFLGFVILYWYFTQFFGLFTAGNQ